MATVAHPAIEASRFNDTARPRVRIPATLIDSVGRMNTRVQ
jgi:hypothetical protein